MKMAHRWFSGYLRLQHQQRKNIFSLEGVQYASCIIATGSLGALIAHHQTRQEFQVQHHPDEILQAWQQKKRRSKELLVYYCLLPLIKTSEILSTVKSVKCDEGLLYAETDFPDDYSEAERFLEVIEYHKTLLPDYIKRWLHDESKRERVTWPKNVPKENEIRPLELDHMFCRRSPNFRNTTSFCNDLKFRIASYYLAKDDPKQQRYGFLMIKELAEHGHADGMCYYGILLNQGRIEGVEANPDQAVVWWRRCVDYHRHIWASFEMGVALYTGEGVAENAALASKFFRQAAHLGHAGAAYMLGDMLLNGVGVERDRASALEWFVTAAELGHPLAQERVLVVIQQDYEAIEKGDGVSAHSQDETLKWANNPENKEAREVQIERRYTIGGGSGNPEVLKRRKTIVKESREDDDS